MSDSVEETVQVTHGAGGRKMDELLGSHCLTLSPIRVQGVSAWTSWMTGRRSITVKKVPWY